VQVKAAAINPSDVKNVLGKMHETTVPRVPGRDFAGIVAEGPEAWEGKAVFGSGGNLGFGRDGTHAEQSLTAIRMLLSQTPALWQVFAGDSVVLVIVATWCSHENRIQVLERGPANLPRASVIVIGQNHGRVSGLTINRKTGLGKPNRH
jgi:NADPH:quinone reductase